MLGLQCIDTNLVCEQDCAAFMIKQSESEDTREAIYMLTKSTIVPCSRQNMITMPCYACEIDYGWYTSESQMSNGWIQTLGHRIFTRVTNIYYVPFTISWYTVFSKFYTLESLSGSNMPVAPWQSIKAAGWVYFIVVTSGVRLVRRRWMVSISLPWCLPE